MGDMADDSMIDDPDYHNAWDGEDAGIDRDTCPLCGGPMHKVKGKFGTFYGCNKFPKCKGSRNF